VPVGLRLKEEFVLAYQKYQWFQKTIVKTFVVEDMVGGLYPGIYM